MTRQLHDCTAIAQEEMDVVIDLINRVEEQEALVVQNVRRPKTRLEALVDEAALRTRTKVLQLQVRRDTAMARATQLSCSRPTYLRALAYGIWRHTVRDIDRAFPSVGHTYFMRLSDDWRVGCRTRHCASGEVRRR